MYITSAVLHLQHGRSGRRRTASASSHLRAYTSRELLCWLYHRDSIVHSFYILGWKPWPLLMMIQATQIEPRISCPLFGRAVDAQQRITDTYWYK
jgi:hypothetical protein